MGKRKKWEIIRYAVEDGKIVKEIIGRYVQFPLKLSYAITIHKSQGQMYDSANLYPSCFAFGQLYVALSRVKSIDTLHLERGILKKDLIVSESVKEFYLRERNTYKKISQETELKNWDKLLEEISNW